MAVVSFVASPSRRPRGWVFPLVILVTLLGGVLCGEARADIEGGLASSSLRTTTVRFESHGQDGYEWATYSARYMFHVCSSGSGPELRITTEFVSGSLRVSPSYIYEGQHIDAPADAAPSSYQEKIEGEVTRPGGELVGSFSDDAATQSRHSCLGNTVTIASLGDRFGKAPSRATLQAFVNSLALSVHTLPPYRNLTLESGARQKKRDALAAEKRAAEQKAAEQQAAAQKQQASSQQGAAQQGASSSSTTSQSSTSTTTSTTPSSGSSSSSQAEPTPPQPTGQEMYEKYKREREAEDEERDARIQEGTEQLAELGQGLMAQEERQAEIRAEHEAEREAAWKERCASVPAVAIPDPTYFVPPGRAFTIDSQYCYRGKYFASAQSLTDAYTFTLRERKTLRFFLSYVLPKTEIVLRRDGADSSEGDIARGTSFARILEPGKYVVRVTLELVGTIILEDPYYLRVVEKHRCWTTNASHVGVGLNQVDEREVTCLGPDGKPAQILKLNEPSSGSLRDIRFMMRRNALSPSPNEAPPSMTLLAGDEGRVLKLAYVRTPTSVVATVDDARPEPFYVIVGARPDKDSASTEFRVDTRNAPYPPRFRGDFSFHAGALISEQGMERSIPLSGGMGFSLGAQLTRLVGLSALVSGAIGVGGVDDGTGKSKAALMLSGLFGPAVHFGTPRTLVRLVPAVSVMKLTDVTVGPAARLEFMTAAGELDAPFRNLGFGLYAEARHNDGLNLFGGGLAFTILPPRRIPPPDDQ